MVEKQITKLKLEARRTSEVERMVFVVFAILFSCTVFSAFFLLNSRSEASAETTQSATASVNVPSACTLTSSGEGSHTANVMPGVFTGDIGITTINATCNDPEGYALYAIGYSNTTFGNTNLIHFTDSSATIPTGTGTTGSNWSMKLAAGTGTETTDIVETYRDYTNVPSSYTKVVNKNSATSPTTGSTVTTTYGTYVTINQKPGTYNGKVKYIMVNPSTADTPIIYNINYNKNTTDEVTNMPTPNPEAGDSTTEIATINSSVPVREGYNFKGWCSVATSDGTCSGTTYNPDGGGTNLNIILDPAGTNNFTLHAMWAERPINMQNFTNQMCQERASDASITIVDERDDNEYTVRWINSNCWMTQNLRFAESTLNPDTSNVAQETTLNWQDLVSDSDCTGDYSSVPAWTEPCKHDSGDASIGLWYNYAAVSAGTITGLSNTDEAIYNICPAGWTLPSEPQFTGVVNYRDNFEPVVGGYYHLGALYEEQDGHWWSSMADGGSNRYFLVYDGVRRYLSLSNLSNRNQGFFARCIHK